MRVLINTLFMLARHALVHAIIAKMREDRWVALYTPSQPDYILPLLTRKEWTEFQKLKGDRTFSQVEVKDEE